MKVFISSVRRQLEEERDALPGHVVALGHECLRFEDFTALSVPPREACMNGVAAADVYVLILGPVYGHRFGDTGQSPTDDEYRAAVARGIPILVFRKDGVDFDADQRAFVDEVSHYVTGRFYNTFTTTADLLTKLTAALRAVEQQPRALTYSPLGGPVEVEWRSSWSVTDGRNGFSGEPSVLEVDVVPLPPVRRSARELAEIADQLPGVVRRSGAIDDDQSVTSSVSDDGVAVLLDVAERYGRENVITSAMLGVRIGRSGQLSVWATLPRDGLGSVIDEEALTDQIASMLRLIGALGLVAPDGTVAIAAGVDNSMMLSVDRVASMPRSQAHLSMSQGPVRVTPDEAVSAAALSNGSVDAARVLARAVARSVSRH